MSEGVSRRSQNRENTPDKPLLTERMPGSGAVDAEETACGVSERDQGDGLTHPPLLQMRKGGPRRAVTSPGHRSAHPFAYLLILRTSTEAPLCARGARGTPASRSPESSGRDRGRVQQARGFPGSEPGADHPPHPSEQLCWGRADEGSLQGRGVLALSLDGQRGPPGHEQVAQGR